MEDYRKLIVRGIKESIPQSSNTKLAFNASQEKDAAWLNRLRKSFQQYSNLDLDKPRRTRLLKASVCNKVLARHQKKAGKTRGLVREQDK